MIERLQIGSRPSRRRDGGIANLRAIPWVFAWSQNRSGLTGWFGIGHALQRGIDEYGLDAMREMARDWPFFAAMTDDVEMLLAKSDLGIFERYSQLAGDLHEAMYPGIAEEFLRSRDAILAIKDAPQMLDGDYRLRLSIRLRNPYVDPISLLQVDLLCRWREGGREDEALLEALVTTVNGIAARLYGARTATTKQSRPWREGEVIDRGDGETWTVLVATPKSITVQRDRDGALATLGQLGEGRP